MTDKLEIDIKTVQKLNLGLAFVLRFDAMIKVLIIVPFSILVAAAILSMFRAFALEKARRHWLQNSRFLITLQSFEEFPHGKDLIIFTNFGFGPEVWHLPDGDETDDLKTSIYTNGRVIMTKNIREIERLCKKYNIEIKIIARKPHFK